MRRKKQRKSTDLTAAARDEDLRDDEGEPAPEPELAEKPKGPNGRLTRSQRWTKRSDNLMKYSAEDVRNATMEFIGPGARDALLRYNGGSKMAAAGEVEAAKSKALDIAKHAKEVAKHAKTTADDAEFLVKALDTAYIDLLTGQGNLDEVEGGRHRESKPPAQPEPAPAAAPAEASAPAEGGALVPPGGPVRAKEIADALLDAIERRRAEQVAQPEEVAVHIEPPAGLLPAPRVGREPSDVPGLDQNIVERLGSPQSFRALGEAVALEDLKTGCKMQDLRGYLRISLEVLAADMLDELELTPEEQAEFRAGQLAALGLADPDAPNPELQGEALCSNCDDLEGHAPHDSCKGSGTPSAAPAQEQAPELRDYLERARAQGRADAPHGRCLHDADKLFNVLMPPPALVPSKGLLYVAYLEAYEAAGGEVPDEAKGGATPAPETSAPKQRGRRGGRGR